MVGAVRGVDPRTGHNYDDTKRYVDQVQLKPEDKARIYSDNARRVFGRLDRVLKERGLLS
jgi:4-oxalmesaconate hydratase